MSERVHLREVGLRDGLQLVRCHVPTAVKIDWLREEAAAGVEEIEVTSFVPAKTFPVFADALEVASVALVLPGLCASALAPNLRGAIAAFDAGFTKVNCVISASEAHSKANVRRTIDEALDDLGRVVAAWRERGLDGTVSLGCGISTAFGCTIQGDVTPDRVFAIGDRLAELGVNEIMIADTVGYAGPGQVEDIFGHALGRYPDQVIAAHFHDTRGLGLANVAAAARVGVRHFDASLGGLGGCPYAPGATGNVDFEDTAYLLETLGYATNIDFSKLIPLRRKLDTWLPGERLVGGIARAGLPKTFRAASEPA